MKKIFFVLAIMAIFASCNKENLGVSGSTDASQITVLAQAPGVDTKSVLGEDGFSVLWEDGDQILVAARPTNSGVNKGYSEATSILSTSLSKSAEKAYFMGSNPLNDYNSLYYKDRAILFYPTSVNYKASSSESISFNLPSNQTARENGSFGKEYNLTAAWINLSNFKDTYSAQTVNFRNVCGLIRFVLPEGVNDITSVTITSTENVLAGNANLYKEITTDRWGYETDYNLHFSSSIDNTKSVTLNNGDQNFVPGVEYNVVVWPGSHSANALKFSFTNTDGGVCEKTIPYAITLNESGVTRFNFKSSFEFTYPAPVYIVKEEIQRAEYLIDGETYVIAWNHDNTKCLVNNNGKLAISSYDLLPLKNEFSEENVFIFNKKSSTLNGADKYHSKTAATLQSLSTGKYIDTSLNISAIDENALEFVVANAYNGSSNSRMDVWRNQSGEKLYLYYLNSTLGTAIAGTAEGPTSDQTNRKWNFYRVERK